MNDSLYYDPIELEMTEAEQGWMVRTVLERRLGVSRKLMSRLKLTEHGITLNGERVYTSQRVQAGDKLAIRMEQEQSLDILPEPIPFSILYEDPYLLIVNKPSGMIVHPTHGHYTGTLANGVVYHWQQAGEAVRFRPVHRLDQETSGVVAIAKNQYVHQQLSEQMQRGEIDKHYCAFLYGSLLPLSGTVNAPIDRNPEQPHFRMITENGYASVTHYETVEIYGHGAASCVRLQLETGRTHQIRVHMQHMGCPLIGDKMYLHAKHADKPWRLQAEQVCSRHALHAERLSFVHPYTRKRVTYEAALPDDLARLQRLLLSMKEEVQPNA